MLWRDELLREIERAKGELRARLGHARGKKKSRLRPGRPTRTVRKIGCGPGDGGFGVGNSCTEEDGDPNRPESFSQGKGSATAARLPATKEAIAAKAASLKAMAKDAEVNSLRKRAAKEKNHRERRKRL